MQNRPRIGQNPTLLKPVDKREAYKNQEIIRQVRHSRDNIPIDSLLILEVIGEGEYGQVHKGIYLPDGKDMRNVAVKKLFEMDERHRKSFEKEANNMMKLNHHCIVELIGMFKDLI